MADTIKKLVDTTVTFADIAEGASHTLMTNAAGTTYTTILKYS